MADWAALYRAANANLCQTARQRRAASAFEAQQYRERVAEQKVIERASRAREREEKKRLRDDLKAATRECNRLERRLNSKRGLTAQERGEYEEWDYLRWQLHHELTGEDCR